MKKLFFTVLLFLTSLSFSMAQDKTSNFDIALEDFKSPLTTYSKYILISGALLSAFIIYDEHNLDDQSKKKAEDKRLLKNYGYLGETLGWGYLNGLYILAFGIHAKLSDNKLSYERSEIMLSSSFYTLATTSLLKLTIDRSRPNFPDKHESFPSGHASMAFNFASVITAEHGIYWGIPAHLIAAAISYSRVNDGWHWFSDLVAGAVIGASYGWGVYLNRRQKMPKFWFSALPGPDRNSFYASLSLNF